MIPEGGVSDWQLCAAHGRYYEALENLFASNPAYPPQTLKALETLATTAYGVNEVEIIVDLIPQILPNGSRRGSVIEMALQCILFTGMPEAIISIFDHVKPHLQNPIIANLAGQCLLGGLRFDKAEPIIESGLPCLESDAGMAPLRASLAAGRSNPTEDITRVMAKLSPSRRKAFTNLDLLEFSRRFSITDRKLLESLPPTDITPSTYNVYAKQQLHLTQYDRASGKNSPETETLPPSSSRMSAGIRRTVEMTRALKAKGKFDDRLKSIEAARHYFAPGNSSPLQVISTGRSGSHALEHALMACSNDFQPLHTMRYQIPAPNRSLLLMKMLDGSLNEDTLETFIQSYLTARIGEWLCAYRHGRTPVVVNHWDSIFAPVIAALFPDSRFLFLRRDPLTYARSAYGKHQWSNGQLQPVSGTYNESGLFLYSAPTIETLPERIAWFHLVTARLVNGLEECLGSDRVMTLDAESIFAHEPTAMSGIIDMFHLENTAVEDLAEAYRTPVNVKEERAAYPSDVLDARCRQVEQALESLSYS